jgi:hypothetical protein
MRPFEISQTVSAQATVDFTGLSALLLSSRRVQRTLMDSPELNFHFRPFLIPPASGESDDYILSPLHADTAPMSHMISALLNGPVDSE